MPRDTYVGRHRTAAKPSRGRAIVVPAVVLSATATGGVVVRAAGASSLDAAAAQSSEAATQSEAGVGGGDPVAQALAERAGNAESASRTARREAGIQSQLDALETASLSVAFAGATTKSSNAVNTIVTKASKTAVGGGASGVAGGVEAGEKNPAGKPATDDHRWVKPFSGYVLTSGYGWRWGKMHPAQDLAAPVGTPVRALSSGVVTFAGWSNSGYGNLVKIEYWDGTVSWYAHNSRLLVSVGDKVAPGEVVSRSGNTGWSTGPHLHIEIHPGGGGAVVPRTWLSKHGITL